MFNGNSHGTQYVASYSFFLKVFLALNYNHYRKLTPKSNFFELLYEYNFSSSCFFVGNFLTPSPTVFSQTEEHNFSPGLNPALSFTVVIIISKWENKYVSYAKIFLKIIVINQPGNKKNQGEQEDN